MATSSNFQKFLNDLPGALRLHLEAVDAIRAGFSRENLPSEAKDAFASQRDEFFPAFNKLETSYKKFISNMVGHTMQQEIDKQSFELFPDTSPNMSKIQFVRMKIIYEWVSSFFKVVNSVWDMVIPSFKIFSTFPITKEFHDQIQEKYLKSILGLNLDTKTMLSKIEKKYGCRIVGSFPKDKDLLISNLIYDEGVDFDFQTLFPELITTAKSKEVTKPNFSKKDEPGFFFTSIIGTKEWNRNDSYILHVKASDLKDEEQKFYSSSFIVLNPSENAHINLAAALVRKNSGFAAASRYNKMVVTLLEYAVGNLYSRDFTDVCEDTHSFLYHTGPVVMWNIIQEDMLRREFGFCYYVEKNSVIKFFPENIIKKHIIDFWAEKFYDLKPIQVDSYISYSKGVSSIKESYRNLYDQAASTRKRITEESIPIDDYLRENTGKFFGYRRAQVYRRFVPDCLWGGLHEMNSTELVNKFFKNR
jgi:hypothetical protein